VQQQGAVHHPALVVVGPGRFVSIHMQLPRKGIEHGLRQVGQAAGKLRQSGQRGDKALRTGQRQPGEKQQIGNGQYGLTQPAVQS